MKSKEKPPPGPFSCREETPPSPWIVTIQCLVTKSDHSPATWSEWELIEFLGSSTCDTCAQSPVVSVTAERLAPEKKKSDVHILHDSPSKKSLFTELIEHPEPKSLSAALNSLLKPRLKKLIKELRINPNNTNELCNKFEDIRNDKSPTQKLFNDLRNATRCRRKQ